MFEILTVCTGNICRSPVAALLLQKHLGPHGARVLSAGTSGLDNASMPDDAQRLAAALGADAADAAAHRSRYLVEADLDTPDLVLAMSREHRRRIVELVPSRLRSTFTVREFARLSTGTTIDAVRTAADTAGDEPSERVRAVVATVAGMRGLGVPPDDPSDDDVVDPFRRSRDVYALAGAQLRPAIEEVVRVLTAAVER